MSNPTQDYLRQRLNYDPETGLFTWREKPRCAKPNQIVGGPDGKGYWRVYLNGRRHLAHRLAWLYVHGEWPAAEIDHKNRDRMDNRISNLRIATRSQNAANIAAHKSNKSGLKGVSYHPKNGKWGARITRDYRTQSLGYFHTPEEAHAAYASACGRVHGEFGRAAA